MRRRHALAALLALTAVATHAEDASPPPGRRELAGHRFLVSHLVEDPFSVTSFGLNTAFGAGEALGDAIDLSTNPPTVTADNKWYGYVSLGEQFDLTVRLLEYLSLHGGLVAGVRQGAGEGSALVVGTNVQVTGTLGAKGASPSGTGSVSRSRARGPGARR